MNIGFFDSGLGGLLILKAVAKELPQYDYVYYGDTKNLPYGDKTEDQIYQLSEKAIGELFARDCQLVIIACNTASAETLRKLQDNYLEKNFPDRRILGVIVPTVENLIEHGVKDATLLATTRTVESKKYEKELDKHQHTNKIVFKSVAMPGLVQLIEENQLDAAFDNVCNVIDTKTGEGEAIILGCTHYTLLKKSLREKYNSSKYFVAQDEVIPDKLRTYLDNHPEIKQKLTSTGKRQIVLTEHRPDYDRLTAEFLGGAYLAD